MLFIFKGDQIGSAVSKVNDLPTVYSDPRYILDLNTITLFFSSAYEGDIYDFHFSTDKIENKGPER